MGEQKDGPAPGRAWVILHNELEKGSSSEEDSVEYKEIINTFRCCRLRLSARDAMSRI